MGGPDANAGAPKRASVVVGGTLHDALDFERNLGFMDACKLYPAAIGWSVFVSLGVIMLAFDPQLLGNLYAMPQFQKDFGYLFDGNVSYSWFRLLSQANKTSTSFPLVGRRASAWATPPAKLSAP